LQRFFTKHVSVFAWSYKDLKGVPPKICEHHIHLEEGAKPICQRQRRLNPKYSLLIKEEIKKLLEIRFIYPVTLFLLKVLVPCGKCSWFKVVIMIFWKGWQSPTPLKPKIHCFLVGGIGSYSYYFLLNLQLK
jgi:hypothetical protein